MAKVPSCLAMGVASGQSMPCGLCRQGQDRRLAHVGRFGGPEHGFRGDGCAGYLGRQERQEHQVGGTAGHDYVRRAGDCWWRGCTSGTNNGGTLRPQITGDKGVLVCLDEATGQAPVAGYPRQDAHRQCQRLAGTGDRVSPVGGRRSAVLRQQRMPVGVRGRGRVPRRY